MAVGKLTVSPETIRGFPSAGYEDSKLFVGCFIKESEKHRTHSVNGPEPFWKNSLDVTVPEGENFLNLEVVNESPNNGGIIATAKVALNQVYSQGHESKWVQLNSNQGRSYGELKLNLTFNGTSSVSSVTSSFGDMNLAGGHGSYQQTTTHSYSTSHNQSDSRQSSFSSLGPSNPIPQNYGSGAPPPFTPPAAVSYPEKSGNNSMPGSNNSYVGTPTAGGLVGNDGVVSPETMSKGEFEEAKARGTIPTWAKYGGGALAGAAALGLAAWGTHELKEHFDEKKKKEEEEEKKHKKDEKPFVPPAGYLQQQQPQQPYTIHNQQHNQEHQSKQYPAPPQQHVSSEHKGDHHKKDKKEKKDKKKSKKHGGSGSDSSSSDSDSSDDERKGKKHDKHHKRRDNEWN